MTDLKDFYQSLEKLNTYETVGKMYWERNRRELRVEELAYLIGHQITESILEDLNSPEAEKEFAGYRETMRQRSTAKGLSAQFYFPEEKDFETEQLLRYVSIPRHKHDFVEFVCVLSGECEHIIEKEHFINHAGDFTIIPPSVEHELHASEDCVCLTTKIRSAAFVQMFSDVLMDNAVLAAYFTQAAGTPFLRCVLAVHCGTDDYVKDCMLRIYRQQIDQKPYAEKIMTNLWNVLLAYMLQNYQDTASFLVSNVIEYEEMLKVLAFVYENYQTVTLASTAEHFHLSVPYLSARIHRLTGRTFSEHLKGYKLQRSTELLTQTDWKLDLICEEIGYSDTAQFIRSFKQVYGLTPMKYRKACKAE